MQPIGQELAIKWSDGREDYLKLDFLRRCCPCASCQGETDIMGNLYKGPDKPLSQKSLELVRLSTVGAYAVQPLWADGHTTGIYSWSYLRQLADAQRKVQ